MGKTFENTSIAIVIAEKIEPITKNVPLYPPTVNKIDPIMGPTIVHKPHVVS